MAMTVFYAILFINYIDTDNHNFRENIPTIKSQTGNLMGTREVWKHLKIIVSYILLVARVIYVWDFIVGIIARKVLLNMGQVLSTLSC